MQRDPERVKNGGEDVIIRTTLSDAVYGNQEALVEPPHNQPQQPLDHPRVMRGWTSNIPPFVPPQGQRKRLPAHKVPVGLGLRANSPLPRRIAAADRAATYAEDVAGAAANEAYKARLQHHMLLQQLAEAQINDPQDAHAQAHLTEGNE